MTISFIKRNLGSGPPPTKSWSAVYRPPSFTGDHDARNILGRHPAPPTMTTMMMAPTAAAHAPNGTQKDPSDPRAAVRPSATAFVVASGLAIASLIATSIFFYSGFSAEFASGRGYLRTNAGTTVDLRVDAGVIGNSTTNVTPYDLSDDHTNRSRGFLATNAGTVDHLLVDAGIVGKSTTNVPPYHLSVVHTNHQAGGGTWPALKEALCPKMNPNLNLARSLFEAARYEIFGDDDSIVLKEGPPSKMISSFYVGHNGASIIMGNNNPKLTILYVKIWKAANNQITGMEKKLARHCNATYNGQIDLPEALKGEPLFLQPKRKYAREGKLCVYTAVRDPVSHFLSGYNEVEYRIINGVSFKQTFDENGVAELAPYANISYSQSAETRGERFKQFVRDVVQEDPVFLTNYVYRHFFAMSRILPTLHEYKLPLTGYLPSLRNLTQAWPAFLKETCPELPDDMPEMGLAGQHESSEDRLGLYRAAKSVWEEGGPTARALCAIHAFDYACFDHSDGVPDLCQDVFESKAFLDRIKGRVSL